MALKILTLLSILISLGESQKTQSQNIVTKEMFMNYGPTTIHSIKGNLYEETEIRKIPKPEVITENLSALKHNNNLDPNVLVSKRKNFIPNNDVDAYMPESQITLNPIEDLLITIHDKHAKESDNSELEHDNISMNSALIKDKPLSFYNERMISDILNNDSVKTIKKELSFDSLLIQNNFENGMYEVPENLISRFMENEIDPEVYNKKRLPTDDSETRRLFPNVYYQPIPPEDIKQPIMTSNNIPVTSRNYDNKLQEDDRHLEHKNIRIEDKINRVEEKGKEVEVTTTSCDEESDETAERNAKEIVLKEPTKGAGISNIVKSRVMLMNHPRVCYACNSITDPSCWSPDRNTAVKYCRGDHPSCITKLYKYRGLSYTIRDCGYVCDPKAEEDPKYTYCTICHHDLCNSAHLAKVQNILIVVVFLFSLSLTR